MLCPSSHHLRYMPCLWGGKHVATSKSFLPRHATRQTFNQGSICGFEILYGCVVVLTIVQPPTLFWCLGFCPQQRREQKRAARSLVWIRCDAACSSSNHERHTWRSIYSMHSTPWITRQQQVVENQSFCVAAHLMAAAHPKFAQSDAILAICFDRIAWASMRD